MNPKIDKVEMDPADSRTVTASGPIGWGPDEASATFMVVIAQVKPKGRIVYATGRGKRTYWPTDERWEARATIDDPNDQFIYGDANGWADASVKETDGTIEPYPWGVKNLKIDHPAVAAAR